MAPPKFNQLLLAHTQTFPESLNAIHALVFQLHCKKPFLDFKVAFKSSWVAAPPGKFNQLLPTHVQTFPENLNEIHSLVFQ